MSARVLIISYYWPPSGGSGVQRWVKFAKYLPAAGWTPVIYTPSNPELTSTDETLLRETSPDLEVIRRPIIEPYGIYHLLSGKKKSSKAEVNPINGDKKTLMQCLFLWIRANLFVPDPRVGWVRPSVRFLTRYLGEHPVDAIITTGPPHSMHLIGRALKRKTGIPWVADFRDPWTDIFYFKYLPLTGCVRKMHFRQELSVLNEASAVIAVSPLVKEDFEAKAPAQGSIGLITNGYDEEDFAEAESTEDGYFNVTHTGLFAAYGIPQTLWDVLRQKVGEDPLFASRLRIRLVGKTDGEVFVSLREYGLMEYVVDCGYRNHLEAVREQKSASLLILPLRKDPEYRKVLPGKLFEYLASGRPVLGIGQSDGAMARVMADLRAASGENSQAGGSSLPSGCSSVSSHRSSIPDGRVFPVTCDWDDREGIRAAVDAAWNTFLSDDKAAVFGASYAEAVRRYSRTSTTASLAALLDSVVFAESR